MNRTCLYLLLTGCWVSGCEPGDIDTGPCIEHYRDESTVKTLDADLPVRVEADERTLMVSADGVRVFFPRINDATTLVGEIHDGIGHVQYQVGEDSIALSVSDVDGVLVFAGGDIFGLRPEIDATFAESRAVSARCSTTRYRGDFTSAEFRTAQPPTTLEAGEERVLQIAGRPYLAGVPWAFEFDDSGVFIGWAFVAAMPDVSAP